MHTTENQHTHKFHRTYNGLSKGDIVEYELIESEVGQQLPPIRGTIIDVVSESQVTIAPISTEPITVSAEWCTRVYNCDDCNDTGEILVERAHQAYSEKLGTYIQDDIYQPCHTCRGGIPRDMYDDN